MMDSPSIQSALTAARYHGSARAALDSNQYEGRFAVALTGLIICDPASMLKIRGGTRLRDPATRTRYVMTHIGLVVDIDHGHVLAYRDLPYPLEIYRYARL